MNEKMISFTKRHAFKAPLRYYFRLTGHEDKQHIMLAMERGNSLFFFFFYITHENISCPNIRRGQLGNSHQNY